MRCLSKVPLSGLAIYCCKLSRTPQFRWDCSEAAMREPKFRLNSPHATQKALMPHTFFHTCSTTSVSKAFVKACSFLTVGSGKIYVCL